MIFVGDMDKGACIMATNGELRELEQFAALIGVRKGQFRNEGIVPVFRIAASQRRVALEHGAVQAGPGVLVDLMANWSKQLHWKKEKA